MNSLTLKSEYSIELGRENSDESNLNSLISFKLKNSNMKIDNLKLSKVSDKKCCEGEASTNAQTMEILINNLSKSKTNLRSKNNMKKVKNKKLKSLNVNSELLETENEIKTVSPNLIEIKSVKHIHCAAFDKLSFHHKLSNSVNKLNSEGSSPKKLEINLNDAIKMMNTKGYAINLNSIKSSSSPKMINISDDFINSPDEEEKLMKGTNKKTESIRKMYNSPEKIMKQSEINNFQLMKESIFTDNDQIKLLKPPSYSFINNISTPSSNIT